MIWLSASGSQAFLYPSRNHPSRINAPLALDEKAYILHQIFSDRRRHALFFANNDQRDARVHIYNCCIPSIGSSSRWKRISENRARIALRSEVTQNDISTSNSSSAPSPTSSIQQQQQQQQRIRSLLNQHQYREALRCALSNNNNNKELYAASLNTISKTIFTKNHYRRQQQRAMFNNNPPNNKNNNSKNNYTSDEHISVGIEALEHQFRLKSAHRSTMRHALRVLCQTRRTGDDRHGHYRGIVLHRTHRLDNDDSNSNDDDVVVVTQKQHALRCELAFRILQRLISGNGMIHHPTEQQQCSQKDKNDNLSTIKIKMPDESEFSAVLNACVEAGRMDLAHQVMALQQRSEGAPPLSAVAYSIMFKGYGRCGNAEAVDRLMDLAQHHSVRPDVVMLNSAMDAYVRCDRVGKARKLLQTMKQNKGDGTGYNKDNNELKDVFCSIRPNARSYNILLKGLAQDGNIDEAIRVSNEMASLKLNDHVTTNTLVNAAIQAGKLVLAERLLADAVNRHSQKQQQQSSLQQDNDKDNLESMSMQVEGYTSLLTGYARAGDLEQAVLMLHAMKKRGAQPNEITYTSLIGAMASAGKIPQAEKMVAYMAESGVRPTVVTYNAFLTGLFSCSFSLEETYGTDAASLVSHSTIEYAKGLLSDMLQSRIRPDDVTVNLLLDAYGRTQEPTRMDEALSILHAMEKEGVVPRHDAKLYTTLMKGFGRNDDIAGARDAFYSIKKPDVFALNAFIDACCRCGDVKAGFKVYNEYVNGGGGDATVVSIVPDAATFSTLISGLGRLESVLVGGKVQNVYNEMMHEWKINPDVGLVDA